ncbi:MAG: GNAT family N-acetyltransferase [Saprospiraceae bacterium]
MELIRYQTTDAFLAVNLGFLEEHEATNNLLLGLAFGIQRGEFPEQDSLLLSVQENGKPIFCAVQTPSRSLVIFGKEKAAKFVPEWLWPFCREKNRVIPGVIGPRDLATTFAKAWEANTSYTYAVEMQQRVFELKQVEKIVFSEGHFRKAAKKDIPIAAEWLAAFHIEAIKEDIKTQAFQKAQELIEAQRLFLWENGEIVSMAASARPTRNGMTVNAVFTPQKHRKKGYATSCVASLSQHLLDQGHQFCALFTDAANPTSNKIYQEIGYREVAKFQSIVFTTMSIK